VNRQERTRRGAATLQRQLRDRSLLVFAPSTVVAHLSTRVFHSGRRTGEGERCTYLATSLSEAGAVMAALVEFMPRCFIKVTVVDDEVHLTAPERRRGLR
jgi:hypothetical protein